MLRTRGCALIARHARARRALYLASVLTTFAGAAAGETLVLQLRDADPARVAGYVADRDRGYYAAEGLEVTILPPDPQALPLQALATGRADVAVERLPTALVARDLGLPVVNIAQLEGTIPLTLLCWRRAEIRDPAADLAGKTVALAPDQDLYGAIAFLNSLGAPAPGGPGGVTLIQRGDEMAALSSRRAACALRAQDALPPQMADELVVFEGDASLLGDGLYAMQTALDDPAAQDRLVRFLRASIRGWNDARGRASPDPRAGAASDKHVAVPHDTGTSPINPGAAIAIERLDTDAAARTAAALTAGSRPVLSAPPTRAWTTAIFDAAANAGPATPSSSGRSEGHPPGD